MSLADMDKGYVQCCREYLKNWIKTYNAEKYRISEEVIDEIIVKGGDGLRELQIVFKKIMDRASEEGVETIDILFLEQILEDV